MKALYLNQSMHYLAAIDPDQRFYPEKLDYMNLHHYLKDQNWCLHLLVMGVVVVYNKITTYYHINNYHNH